MNDRLRRIAAVAFMLLSMSLSPGCAHKREAFYPNSRGVHVNAPFVDVNVPAGPRVHVNASGIRPTGQPRRLNEPPLLLDDPPQD